MSLRTTSGHTVTLRSAQIQPNGWTSDTLGTSGCVKSQKI